MIYMCICAFFVYLGFTMEQLIFEKYFTFRSKLLAVVKERAKTYLLTTPVYKAAYAYYSIWEMFY